MTSAAACPTIAVNLKDIMDAKTSQISELAARFNPPVSTENCMTVAEKRERLRCAYGKVMGTSRDLDNFGKMMEELKVSDSKKRNNLWQLFEQARRQLEQIVLHENIIDKQLQQEDSTRDYVQKIRAFQDLLRQEDCPVVVAGQVSSGKSTLLNLFLGEELLPNQLLSCTATICELAYAETPRAELLCEDGSLYPIPLADKDMYIFKSSEREKRFDHEAVRLHLPVPFLKSGITLVDTPGVGENKEMWEVVTDYVTQKDVFGFIFAIKCDDAGGILNRFKEMLRQLSMIKDRHGQYKFDPKSVIFVANFWDKVKKEEKPVVRDSIEETLRKEPCLKGIDLKNQLFFVNSRFAWHTWKVGLISEDYEKLIEGVERFFPIGHKQKLKRSYNWLENLLLRVLHPVNAFLNKAECSSGTLNKSSVKVTKKLAAVDELTKEAKQKIRTRFDEKRKSLMLQLEEFFKNKYTRKAVTTWKLGEIPKEEYGDSWILIEERIDKVIDQRVSSVLQEWEVSNKFFESADMDIVTCVKTEYSKVSSVLEELEKMLRDISGDKGRTSTLPSTIVEASPDEKPREFHVDVSHDFSSEQPALHSILNNLLTNPTSLFSMEKTYRRKVQQKSAEMFQSNKVKYMEERSDLVFSRLKDSEQTVRQLVDDQLRTPERTMEFVYSNACGLINSNRLLLDELQNDKREKPQLQQTYRPLADQLNCLMERTISFMYQNVHDYDLPGNVLKEPGKSDGKAAVMGHIQQTSVVSVIRQLKNATNHEMVSAKQMIAHSAFKQRHLFFMAKNLRTLSKYRNAADMIPKLLGTGLYLQEPALVFEGTMTSARKHLLGTKKTTMNRAFYINTDVMRFMTSVSTAVDFLHLRRVVHIDLSLDSVHVQNDKPKLSNIFESIEVPYPSSTSNSQAGNYVYMAPETFPNNGSKRYSDAADVYALGLMLLELWAQCDLYETPVGEKSRPKQWRLFGFMAELDPGAKLFQCIDLIDDPGVKKDLPEELIKGCLNPNPRMRFSTSEWNSGLKKLKKTNYR